MTPVIIAKDLYKCYPGFAPVLRGVNLTVTPGEIVAIMGPSGCGKSTMLHLLGMLHKPDAGTLQVLGQDVFALGREATAAFRRGNMGFVMQSNNLFDHSTVFENVEFPLIYENIPPDERWERVTRALELVRLSHRVNYRSNRLSGGEQQRVAVARAMVNNPRILLADEPTGALDTRTSKVVMENFRTLAHQGRVAMVVVTHDAGVAEYCDSVYTLEDGLLTCRRQNPVPEYDGDIRLLDVAPRRMNAVCVAAQIPTGTLAIQDVRALHQEGVLARVYALQGAGIAAVAAGDMHGLPVPVRRQSLWGLPAALAALWRHRGNASRISQLWQRLPLRMRLNIWQMPRLLYAFAVGARLAAWAVLDKVEHIHSLDARASALPAWIASGLLGIPFSLSVRTQDVCGGNPLLSIIIKDAAFIRCDSQTVLDRVRRLYPEAGAACTLMRGGLPLALPEPEESGMPTDSGKAQIRLLTVMGQKSRTPLNTLLRACVLLKKHNAPVYLTIMGSTSLWARCCLRIKIWQLGLRKDVQFLGHTAQDSVSEIMQKTHIFVSLPTKHTKSPCASLIEAMIHALAIVVSDTPDQTEYIQHEKNGLVLPQLTSAALTEALLHLMRFPDTAAALGTQAQADIVQMHDATQSHLLADAILNTQKKA